MINNNSNLKMKVIYYTYFKIKKSIIKVQIHLLLNN